LEFHSAREADHSPPSSAEVKEWVELYLHSPNAPSWLGNFSLHQTGSGAHPPSSPMGTRGLFPGGKAAGALS
jgi:hypothetical protein